MMIRVDFDENPSGEFEWSSYPVAPQCPISELPRGLYIIGDHQLSEEYYEPIGQMYSTSVPMCDHVPTGAKAYVNIHGWFTFYDSVRKHASAPVFMMVPSQYLLPVSILKFPTSQYAANPLFTNHCPTLAYFKLCHPTEEDAITYRLNQLTGDTCDT